MTWSLYSRGSAKGLYHKDVRFFPTFLDADLRWGIDAIWNISIILNTTSKLEFTIDGGITWFDLNPAGPIPAFDERTFNIKAGDKDSFNLRTPDSVPVDVYRALVSIDPEDIMRPRSDVDVNVVLPGSFDSPALERGQRLQLQKLNDIEKALYLIVLHLQEITGSWYSTRDVNMDVLKGR